jgi:hypothetical protein
MTIHSRKFSLISGIGILLILLVNQAVAGEFAVSPMMIDIVSESRQKQKFSFSVFGKSDTNIKLELFDMNQLETGYMGFVEVVENDAESMSSWVDLETDSFRIRDGETATITGTVNVPARASGSHLVGVMVEEDIPAEEQSGVSVKIRYAVVLNLQIEGRYNRIKTEFGELVVVSQGEETYLEGYFSNNSAIDNWLFSEVQLRGEDNRLLERVPLKSESAWQRGDDGSRVFPDARVRLFGKISKHFEPGSYKVLVRNKFADKAQPVFRDMVYLEAPTKLESTIADSENGLASELPTAGAVLVNPEAVEISIRDNGTSFTSFFITNSKSEAVNVVLPSAIENLELSGVSEFKFYPETIALKPNQRSRVVLRQTHLADVNYGNIVFQAKISADSLAPEEVYLAISTVGGS